MYNFSGILNRKRAATTEEPAYEKPNVVVPSRGACLNIPKPFDSMHLNLPPPKHHAPMLSENEDNKNQDDASGTNQDDDDDGEDYDDDDGEDDGEDSGNEEDDDSVREDDKEDNDKKEEETIPVIEDNDCTDSDSQVDSQVHGQEDSVQDENSVCREDCVQDGNSERGEDDNSENSGEDNDDNEKCTAPVDESNDYNEESTAPVDGDSNSDEENNSVQEEDSNSDEDNKSAQEDDKSDSDDSSEEDNDDDDKDYTPEEEDTTGNSVKEKMETLRLCNSQIMPLSSKQQEIREHRIKKAEVWKASTENIQNKMENEQTVKDMTTVAMLCAPRSSKTPYQERITLLMYTADMLECSLSQLVYGGLSSRTMVAVQELEMLELTGWKTLRLQGMDLHMKNAIKEHAYKPIALQWKKDTDRIENNFRYKGTDDINDLPRCYSIKSYIEVLNKGRLVLHQLLKLFPGSEERDVEEEVRQFLVKELKPCKDIREWNQTMKKFTEEWIMQKQEILDSIRNRDGITARDPSSSPKQKPKKKQKVTTEKKKTKAEKKKTKATKKKSKATKKQSKVTKKQSKIKIIVVGQSKIELDPNNKVTKNQKQTNLVVGKDGRLVFYGNGSPECGTEAASSSDNTEDAISENTKDSNISSDAAEDDNFKKTNDSTISELSEDAAEALDEFPNLMQTHPEYYKRIVLSDQKLLEVEEEWLASVCKDAGEIRMLYIAAIRLSIMDKFFHDWILQKWQKWCYKRENPLFYAAAIVGASMTSVQEWFRFNYQDKKETLNLEPPTKRTTDDDEKNLSQKDQYHNAPSDEFKLMANSVMHELWTFLNDLSHCGVRVIRLEWVYHLINEMKKKEPASTAAITYEERLTAMLICLILSAATGDALCIAATASLYKESLLSWSELSKDSNKSSIRDCIKVAGIHNDRLQYLMSNAKTIMKQHHGRTPNDMQSLLKLKGVGRKTAVLFAVEALGMTEEGIGTDCHVMEESYTLGLYHDGKSEQLNKHGVRSKNKRKLNPMLVEDSLRTWIPPERYKHTNMIFGGLAQVFKQEMGSFNEKNMQQKKIMEDRMRRICEAIGRHSGDVERIQLLFSVIAQIRNAHEDGNREGNSAKTKHKKEVTMEPQLKKTD